jgi:hypothetical protein
MYAEKMIRGISDPGWVSDGYASAALFQFKESNRLEGFSELSINWYDDEGALDHILNQKKETGNIQFKGGAAILSKESVNSINKIPQYIGTTHFDRDILPDNRYHGNIIISSNLHKMAKLGISQYLAMHVEDIIPSKSKTEIKKK